MKNCMIVNSKKTKSGHTLPLSGMFGLGGACPVYMLIKNDNARPKYMSLLNGDFSASA